MTQNLSLFFTLLVLLHALNVGDGTLSKSSKKKGKKNGGKEVALGSRVLKAEAQTDNVWQLPGELASHCTFFFKQLSSKTVFERGLVSKEVKPRDILKNYQSYCKPTATHKEFENNLVYVTPVSLYTLGFT